MLSRNAMNAKEWGVKSERKWGEEKSQMNDSQVVCLTGRYHNTSHNKARKCSVGGTGKMKFLLVFMRWKISWCISHYIAHNKLSHQSALFTWIFDYDHISYRRAKRMKCAIQQSRQVIICARHIHWKILRSVTKI